MWGLEHSAMLLAVIVASSLLVWRSRFADLVLAVVSQAPFWVGVAVYMLSNGSIPAEINAASNLIAAGMFASMAENRQAQGRRGIAQIYLCVLFLLMASLDAMYVLTPFSVYVILQEIGHYLALILIWGRAYVERMHGGVDNSLRQAGNGKSGDLV